MDLDEPYNPLDKLRLGESVANAIVQRPVTTLPPEHPFDGAGVYVIYYSGLFPTYEPLAAKNRSGDFVAPIYIGKAVPAGTRRGGLGLDIPPGRVLYRRLVEHAESIKAVRNLDIRDFRCRYLVVDDIWIPLGESLLIRRHSPLWNSILDGFGNHDPGSGRCGQRRSPWDVIHPGRQWAERCAPCTLSEQEILNLLAITLESK